MQTRDDRTPDASAQNVSRNTGAFKKTSGPPKIYRLFLLARPAAAASPRLRFIVHPPTPRFMILVAIFCVIVLLMCWVCYNGDCNS